MPDPAKPPRTHAESKMRPTTPGSSSADASQTKRKVVRGHRIPDTSSPTAAVAEQGGRAGDFSSILRSHTPGHLASKSHSAASGRRKTSEPNMRSRSQSAGQARPSTSKPSPAGSSGSRVMPSSAHTSSTGKVDRPPAEKRDSNATDASRETAITPSANTASASKPSGQNLEIRRPAGMRSTSAIASKSISSSSHHRQTSATAAGSTRASGGGHRSHSHIHHNKHDQHIPFPPLQDPRSAPDVPSAPSSGMYWSRAPVSGASHTALRAHVVTLVGSNVYIFGGCDSRACFNQLYVLDADSFYWSRPHVVGDIPIPLRAMTCTAVGKKLVIFGGGDGPAYYNDVYVLDITNFRWSKPRILSDRLPSKRRAHTACLYKSSIYVFGGGDGIRALNDIWKLDASDVNKMTWKLINGPSSTNSSGKDVSKPKARGYHTANMVGSKLIIFGGSDGGECFNDVWVYDVDTNIWRAVNIPVAYRRLSHTATVVGSYLFVIGGHDGNEYSNDLLLLNLVTMAWDKRKVHGLPPSGRGYHGAVLYDSRVLVIGGFDGDEVFGDVWILELAVYSYYSQISHFTIEV